MGTGHPLSCFAIGYLAGVLGQYGGAVFVESILNIHVALNHLTVGPHWHRSLLTLGEERLNGLTGLGGGTLNIHTVGIALDFSFMKWPLGIVSTAVLFRSQNVRLSLDCPCRAVVTKRVKKHRWGDWAQTAIFFSGLRKSLYYRVFLRLPFGEKRKTRIILCTSLMEVWPTKAIFQQVGIIQKRNTAGKGICQWWMNINP